MTLQQLIELIQEQAPEVGEKQALVFLNQAQQEFARKTEILRKKKSFTSQEDTRNYPLPDDVIKVRKIYANGNEISPLHGYPEYEDTSEGTM